MIRTVHGRIRGTIIELDEDLGVPEGQEVEVEIRLLKQAELKKTSRRLGTMQGTVTYMSPDFDAPLDEFEDYMQ
jgi:hypothetical protein